MEDSGRRQMEQLLSRYWHGWQWQETDGTLTEQETDGTATEQVLTRAYYAGPFISINYSIIKVWKPVKGIIIYLAEPKKYRTSTKQITKNNYNICFLSGDLKTAVHWNNKTLDLGHKPFFLLWHWDVDNLGIWSSRLLAEGGFELLTLQFPPS